MTWIESSELPLKCAASFASTTLPDNRGALRNRHHPVHDQVAGKRTVKDVIGLRVRRVQRLCYANRNHRPGLDGHRLCYWPWMSLRRRRHELHLFLWRWLRRRRLLPLLGWVLTILLIAVVVCVASPVAVGRALFTATFPARFLPVFPRCGRLLSWGRSGCRGLIVSLRLNREIVDDRLHSRNGSGVIGGQGTRGIVTHRAIQGGNAILNANLDVLAGKRRLPIDLRLDIVGYLLVCPGLRRVRRRFLLFAASPGQQGNRDQACSQSACSHPVVCCSHVSSSILLLAERMHSSASSLY